ncbi:chemotaxis protein methyltransferase CheR [Neptunomonas japonica JAMM 1380]|uniref:Chemotaxis protein methyltransferase n=2 Tax=Neptunomonas TaxID=75687 RepID=A0A7R6PMS5_9GAMM|nr:chemotaxis protein methyltransferase CheR [Neptunomonas japonica JAMM 1380]
MAVIGMNVSPEREFVFTDQDFETIRSQLYKHAGIALSDYKKDMVYNRLVRRIRVLSLGSFSAYFSYLASNVGEFPLFINALTTNLTAFFRESHHFEFLKQVVIPDVDAGGLQRIRIWSAGCSMGEEPYSLAMALRTTDIDLREWDIKILATDIDSDVLEIAQTGMYGVDRIDAMPPVFKTRFFRKGRGQYSGMVKIADELKEMITFKELNLMHSWPMKGPLDAIFCRNVMIYFDKETQKLLLNRMADLLKPGGFLFVGHSESPFRLTDRFKLIGNTIYQKDY